MAPIGTGLGPTVTADEALRDSERRLRLALQAGQIGVWDVDLAGGRRTWSDELKAILGLPAHQDGSEALLLALVLPKDRPLVEEAHRTAFAATEDLVFRIKRADTGAVRWILSRGNAMLDDAGTPIRRLGTFQDITLRKEAERELVRLANDDPLTGLANRASFLRTLDAAVAGPNGFAALLVIDLDRFKEMNDARGHAFGDNLLKAFADRMRALGPPGATLARLGGDEFAILVTDPVEAVEPMAAALHTALSTPLRVEEYELHCALSSGLAVFPVHDLDGRELLTNADLALAAAKRVRARLSVFDPAMKVALLKRVAVLDRARSALLEERIMPWYQPKVTTADGRVCGFEALLRWRDGRRIGSPGDIASAFEDPELADRIGARMLTLVARDLRRWRRMGVDVGSVAVNAAAAEFTRGDLAARWLAVLDAHGLPPSALQMEVTETVFLDAGSEAVGVALAKLHGAGIAIALDDFGTGHASLTHLRRFPVQWLKIDQSFTRDLADAPDAHAIVAGVVHLAHAIGFKVVAEGVETAAQLAQLRHLGCDVVQGYFAAKPMPASRVSAFLRGWAGLGAAG